MEDRQVQHIFESNATSAALAPNVAWPGDRTHAHDICAEKNISDYEAIVGSKAQKRSFVCF